MKKLPRRQCIITVREVEMLRYIANAAIFCGRYPVGLMLYRSLLRDFECLKQVVVFFVSDLQGGKRVGGIAFCDKRLLFTTLLLLLGLVF